MPFNKGKVINIFRKRMQHNNGNKNQNCNSKITAFLPFISHVLCSFIPGQQPNQHTSFLLKCQTVFFIQTKRYPSQFNQNKMGVFCLSENLSVGEHHSNVSVNAHRYDLLTKPNILQIVKNQTQVINKT